MLIISCQFHKKALTRDAVNLGNMGHIINTLEVRVTCMCSDEGKMTDDRSKEAPSSWDSETNGGSDELDSVLHAIRNRRRRHILYHLQDHEVSQIDDLALAACQAECDRSDVDDEQLNRMSATILHSDLPALQEGGFIDYDQRSQTARYQTPSRLLEMFLRICVKIGI